MCTIYSLNTIMMTGKFSFLFASYELLYLNRLNIMPLFDCFNSKDSALCGSPPGGKDG